MAERCRHPLHVLEEVRDDRLAPGRGHRAEAVIDVIAKLNVNDESCSNHFVQYGALEGLTGDQSGPARDPARPQGAPRRLRRPAEPDRRRQLLHARDHVLPVSQRHRAMKQQGPRHYETSARGLRRPASPSAPACTSAARCPARRSTTCASPTRASPRPRSKRASAELKAWSRERHPTEHPTEGQIDERPRPTAIQGTPAFDPLAHQLDDIHDASMRILRQTGVRVYSDEATALLANAGAHVGAGGLVKIPAHLIEWAVRSSPSSITIYDRNGAEAMQVGRRRTYFGTGSDTPNVIDPYTGERRRPLLADIAGFARVGDALPNIDFLMCMGIASDVGAETAELHHFAAMMRNSTKPIVYTALDVAAAGRLLEMASVVAGGEDAFRQRPFAIMYIEPVSPLGFAPDDMQKLLFCADHGIPCIFMSGMLSGGTGPVTPAGGLALANAESLAGILIAQLKRKGTPVVSGGGILTLDMRTSVSSYGSPEFMLTMAAISELAEYYDLPAWGYAGCTDAKCFDEQAAADAATWVMMAALSGSNLAHDVGFIEGGMTSSFEQLVFTNEMIGKCAHLLGGIRVDEESLAVGSDARRRTRWDVPEPQAHVDTLPLGLVARAGGSAEPWQLGEGRIPHDARSGERQGPAAPRQPRAGTAAGRCGRPSVGSGQGCGRLRGLT